MARRSAAVVEEVLSWSRADFSAAASGPFDRVVAVLTPGDLPAVGQYYADFGPVSDAEVRELLGPAVR